MSVFSRFPYVWAYLWSFSGHFSQDIAILTFCDEQQQRRICIFTELGLLTKNGFNADSYQMYVSALYRCCCQNLRGLVLVGSSGEMRWRRHKSGRPQTSHKYNFSQNITLCLLFNFGPFSWIRYSPEKTLLKMDFPLPELAVCCALVAALVLFQVSNTATQ